MTKILTLFKAQKALVREIWGLHNENDKLRVQNLRLLQEKEADSALLYVRERIIQEALCETERLRLELAKKQTWSTRALLG